MIKRTLYFGNPAYLRLKDKQLSIESIVDGETKTATVPVEDIGIMVFRPSSNYYYQRTDSGIAGRKCGIDHLATGNTCHKGLLLPIEGNKTQRERLHCTSRSYRNH